MTTNDAQVIAANPILVNDTLQSMFKSMHAFAANTEKIARTIQVINEIAFQSSILALGKSLGSSRGVESTVNAGMGMEEIAEEVLVPAGRGAPAVSGNRVRIA